MATKTSLQTGTIPTPFASNTQDHSVSDDEILDNFAEGPDDGIPLGVGGEKGKQAEPASSTLEADILRGTTPKQPGEEVPPDSASEAQPVQEPAGETGPETPPEPSDSDEPEIPPMLLQMAGYADADAAKADGLGSPEALNAFIRGRGQLLASQPAAAPDGQPQPYLRPEQTPPAPPPAPAAEQTETPGEFKPFELSEDDVNVLDEQLQDTIRRMNEHNQRQFQVQEQRLQSLQASLSDRETNAAARQAEEEVVQFDQAVQNLGDDWRDVFGEGTANELVSKAQTDPAARLALEYRRELYSTVQAIRDVNSQRGFESMDLNREIGFGLMQRFPDKFQQTVSGNPSTPTRTSLNRPTQRRSPPTQQDKLLERLAKQHPGAGFMATGEDEFEGEI